MDVETRLISRAVKKRLFGEMFLCLFGQSFFQLKCSFKISNLINEILDNVFLISYDAVNCSCPNYIW